MQKGFGSFLREIVTKISLLAAFYAPALDGAAYFRIISFIRYRVTILRFVTKGGAAHAGKQALESLTESMFYLLMALTQGEALRH